jgi:Tol biopolymer transport system component
MSRTGGMLRRLTTGFYVYLFSYAWSPDSRYLVFTASDDHNTTIHSFTYDLNTNKLTKLVLTHK